MSTNQTGHQQNVINLGVVLARIDPFRESYKPIRNELSLYSLNQLKTTGESAIAMVTLAENNYKISTSERAIAFDKLDGLITRVINALRISGASSPTIAQAEAIVRDLRGKRVHTKPVESENPGITQSATDPDQVTLHKGSADSRIINFNKLVRLLSLVPLYKPNETDLCVPALDARLNELKSLNSSLIAADAALDAARWDRNSILYKPDSGLVDIALAVKMYVKSVFGAVSPQYKEISDIIFSKSR